jgi:hypothetical protein
MKHGEVRDREREREREMGSTKMEWLAESDLSWWLMPSLKTPIGCQLSWMIQLESFWLGGVSSVDWFEGRAGM